MEDQDLMLLLEKIYRDRNFDLREYKKTSLKRRIERRLRATKSKSYKDYMKVLDSDPREYDKLLDDLTIKVTEFFRDPQAFQVVKELILPQILAAKEKAKDYTIRVWSAGCASGQEPYSIAMLLAEKLGPRLEDFEISIYGTDVNEGVISEARRAEYREESVSGVKQGFLDKYFTYNGKYKLKREIRQLVKFGRHDLATDPPISHLDLLICRNVAIYFSRSLQDKVFMTFHYALNKGGFLLIGKAEVVTGEAAKLFKMVNREWRVYQKL